MNRILHFAFFSLFVSNIYGQSLVRGPYLQSLLPTSVKILWRTDIASAYIINYGTDLNNLNQTVHSDSLATDHIAYLPNLTANTTYYYEIISGTSVLAGGNEQHHFKTAPEFGSTQPFRFWALGDFGARNDDQIKVWRSFLNYTAEKPADFWIWLGDNTYSDGKDIEYQLNVFSNDYGYDSIFRFLPFYPTPGNHDYESVTMYPSGLHTGPYFNIVEVFKNGEAGGQASNTEKYYSYDYGNVHFISLNSEAYGEVLLLNQNMKNWLINDLQKNVQPWTIVYWHQPPFSKGSHDSDASYEVIMKSMRENYLPILEQYGVDIVINGHSHVYERSRLQHGHYGKSFTFDTATHVIQGGSGNIDTDGAYTKPLTGDSSTIGTVYIVCGNGAKSETNPPLNHPVFYISEGGDNVCGSMIVDVEDKRMDIRYLKSTGEVFDYFTFLKYIPVGVQQQIIFEKLHIYPNPGTGKYMVELEAKESVKSEIWLVDHTGRSISQLFIGLLPMGKSAIQIETPQGLRSGQYFLQLKTEKGDAKAIPFMNVAER